LCVQGIDPHLLLLIFLPTIGFSAALNQQPHLLRRNWGQVRVTPWHARTALCTWRCVWRVLVHRAPGARTLGRPATHACSPTPR
jgi:hypothetical protein